MICNTHTGISRSGPRIRWPSPPQKQLNSPALTGNSEMHATLFANGDHLSAGGLLMLARQLGLNAVELQVALDQGTYAPKVDADFRGGVRTGVNGTPCFFVNGVRHNGPYDGRRRRSARVHPGERHQDPGGVIAAAESRQRAT
jgi:hypothetical protein